MARARRNLLRNAMTEIEDESRSIESSEIESSRVRNLCF